MTKLDIALAREAPETYRQQFLKLRPEPRSAHLQSLDAEGLRAHARATGETLTWWLSLTLHGDLTPRAVECGIAGKRRTFRFEPGVSFDTWLRPQLDFIKQAGCVSGPCMLSLPIQIELDEARPVLRKLLGESLPSVGWHPTCIELNTTGFSDRGEPPDPSTSLRVQGRVRLPAFPWLDRVQFVSTVAILKPMVASEWRAVLGSIASQLGIELREI